MIRPSVGQVKQPSEWLFMIVSPMRLTCIYDKAVVINRPNGGQAKQPKEGLRMIVSSLRLTCVLM